MKKKLAYFLKNYQLYYQIEDISIGYGEIENGNVLIAKSVEKSFFTNKKDINPRSVIWKAWNGIKIPFLFDDDDNCEILTVKNGQVKINYDIVASTFYFLSGWNEYINPTKDKNNRLIYENSFIQKLNIINIPVVNYYFDILHSAILKVQQVEKKAIWGEKSFGVALTHDIDTCKGAWLEGSFSELKKKHFLSIPKLIFKRLLGKDAWFNFNLISQIDKQYGDSSSFYFLSQKGKLDKRKNADYNISSRSIQKEISELKESGHEIGVHGSFGTHVNVNKFKNDITRLKTSPIIGNRFHFLMFDIEKTVTVLEKSNIKYDTSLGFAEQIGFRRSTCYPFFLYNFEEDRISDVIEIPLIVMDGTLGDSKYMGLSFDESFEKVKLIIDEIIKFNGVFTLLWHNTFFSDYKYAGWKEVYVKILEYCKKNNGLLTSGKVIFEKVNQKQLKE